MLKHKHKKPSSKEHEAFYRREGWGKTTPNFLGCCQRTSARKTPATLRRKWKCSCHKLATHVQLLVCDFPTIYRAHKPGFPKTAAETAAETAGETRGAGGSAGGTAAETAGESAVSMLRRALTVSAAVPPALPPAPRVSPAVSAAVSAALLGNPGLGAL